MIYISSTASSPAREQVRRLLDDLQLPYYDAAENFPDPDPDAPLTCTAEEWRKALNTVDRTCEVYQARCDALMDASLGILIAPAGPSAHLEAGYLLGFGTPVIIYLERLEQPAQMYSLARYDADLCVTFDELRARIEWYRDSSNAEALYTAKGTAEASGRTWDIQIGPTGCVTTCANAADHLGVPHTGQVVERGLEGCYEVVWAAEPPPLVQEKVAQLLEDWMPAIGWRDPVVPPREVQRVTREQFSQVVIDGVQYMLRVESTGCVRVRWACGTFEQIGQVVPRADGRGFTISWAADNKPNAPVVEHAEQMIAAWDRWAHAETGS